MRNDRTMDILQFIERFIAQRGFPPTIREIGHQFGIASTNGVRYHLNRLEKAGKLRRSEKISRGIETVRRPVVRPAGIPILGNVAAGQPILAEESFEGHLAPDDLFGSSGELFALRVRGDSMIEAGVFENDFVVVRQQNTASAGDMVVALLEDEATVKYYKPGPGGIELVPANAKYRPIPVREGVSFQILGVVRGLVRPSMN
jgi:repressor LexA